MTTNLLERLRDAAVTDCYGCGAAGLCAEAAREIERLREAVERLRRTVDAGDLAGMAQREAGR